MINPLVLELQEVVSCLMWVLETELKPFVEQQVFLTAEPNQLNLKPILRTHKNQHDLILYDHLRVILNSTWDSGGNGGWFHVYIRN